MEWSAEASNRQIYPVWSPPLHSAHYFVSTGRSLLLPLAQNSGSYFKPLKQHPTSATKTEKNCSRSICLFPLKVKMFCRRCSHSQHRVDQYSIMHQRVLHSLLANDVHPGYRQELFTTSKRGFQAFPGAKLFCSYFRNFLCSNSDTETHGNAILTQWWCLRLCYSQSLVSLSSLHCKLCAHNKHFIALQADGSKYRINKHPKNHKIISAGKEL